LYDVDSSPWLMPRMITCDIATFSRLIITTVHGGGGIVALLIAGSEPGWQPNGHNAQCPTAVGGSELARFDHSGGESPREEHGVPRGVQPTRPPSQCGCRARSGTLS